MESTRNAALTDLANFINGYAFAPDDFTDQGLPVIRIEQLKDPNAPTDLFDGKVSARNEIDNGDLIFSWSASLFLDIWNRGKAILNQHLFKVLPKQGVDKSYLKHCIEYHLPELTKSAHGSTMQHITRRELGNFRVDIPTDTKVQAKIADVLATVDAAIKQTEALIAKYQRIKTGLMHDLLTRGIDEQGRLRTTTTHQFKDSPFGKIPMEWEVEHLGKLVKIHHGYAFQGKFFSDVDNGIILLTPGNFHVGGGLYFETGNTKYYTGEASDKFVLQNGDVVTVMTDLTKEMAILGNTVRLQHPYRILHNQRIGLVRKRPDVPLSEDFLVLIMNSRVCKRVVHETATGTTVRHTSPDKISSALIPIPKVDEQERITNLISRVQSQMDVNSEHLTKLQHLKMGLMQDLLSGNVSVEPLLSDIEHTSL